MKNNALLPALLLILTGQTLFSQKTLPPGVRPYAENWTYTLVKSLHRAGFDMPAMAAMPASENGVNGRSTLQLDSTKTFYAYDLNAPGDSAPLFRTIYQYPSGDTKIEINYQYDNGAWLTLNRSTLTSDGQQRLVDAFAEVFDPATQSYKPDSRLEVFPRGNSQVLVDSFFTYLWDTSVLDWRLTFSGRNLFDDADRLLESYSSVDYLGTPLVFRDVYSYDTLGDNNLIETFALVDGEEYPGGHTDLVYADHRLIEETAYSFDGAEFVPQNRDNYAYTLSGALRRHMKFEWDAEKGGWHLFQTIDYSYDNEQRLAGKETAFLPLNAQEEREFVAYAYVQDENLYTERVYLWDDDLFDWVLDSKKYFYYTGLVSADPAPGKALTLRVSPNPTTGLVQFSFAGDGEASVRLYDVAGQLLQSRLVQPGQPLDLTALPAGVYNVTARQDAELYSGKIVKQ